ncbi:unnamed protein product, partial [Phaeothamnion confervicola]
MNASAPTEGSFSNKSEGSSSSLDDSYCSFSTYRSERSRHRNVYAVVGGRIPVYAEAAQAMAPRHEVPAFWLLPNAIVASVGEPISVHADGGRGSVGGGGTGGAAGGEGSAKITRIEGPAAAGYVRLGAQAAAGVPAASETAAG